jgi:GntR family transcriptional repressor for pyruvate dehydrogenase complex
MRKHLHNSLGRVRALARASGVEATEAEQKAAAASLFTDMKRPSPTGG